MDTDDTESFALTAAERNTILAGLRCLQKHGPVSPAPDDDEAAILDDAAIDDLCEAINCGPNDVDPIQAAAGDMLQLLVDLLSPGSVNAGLLEEGRDLLARLGHDVRRPKDPSAAGVSPAPIVTLSQLERQISRLENGITRIADQIDRQVKAADGYAAQSVRKDEARPTVWELQNGHFRDLAKELRDEINWSQRA